MGLQGTGLVRRVRGGQPQDVWSELSSKGGYWAGWGVSWRELLVQGPQVWWECKVLKELKGLWLEQRTGEDKKASGVRR